MNWRKAKKNWKRDRLWSNGSNKSLHTFCRILFIHRPRWGKLGK